MDTTSPDKRIRVEYSIKRITTILSFGEGLNRWRHLNLSALIDKKASETEWESFLTKVAEAPFSLHKGFFDRLVGNHLRIPKKTWESFTAKFIENGVNLLSRELAYGWNHSFIRMVHQMLALDQSEKLINNPCWEIRELPKSIIGRLKTMRGN